MDLELLARNFSAWKGRCYTYTGVIPEGTNSIAYITGCVSRALETNNFISRISKINSVYYVYLEDHSVDSTDFQLMGEINGQPQGAE